MIPLSRYRKPAPKAGTASLVLRAVSEATCCLISLLLGIAHVSL